MLKENSRYEVGAREQGRIIFEVDPEDKMDILGVEPEGKKESHLS